MSTRCHPLKPTFRELPNIRTKEFDGIMKDKADFSLVLEVRAMGCDWNRPSCLRRDKAQTANMAGI